MSFTAMTIMQGVLLLFILIGFLFGLWKGFGKSVIRLFTVLAMAVVCFFCTPPISKALAATNISNLGIDISGVKVTTINEALTLLLKKIGIINEFMESSPTFSELVKAIPVLVLNLVVFFIFFLVLLTFSHIFSWLIAKLTLKKQKKGEHKRFRLLGGLVATVQAVIVFAILAVPVFGIADTIQAAFDASESTQSVTAAYIQENETYSLMSSTTSSAADEAEEKIEKIKSKVSPYLEDYNKTIFVKVFKAIGLASIDTKVYNKLTTVTVNEEDVTLKNEIVVFAKASKDISVIASLSESSTEQDFKKAQRAVSSMFESSLFSRIAEETVKHVALAWQENEEAFGIKKPDLGEMANPLIDEAINQLSSTNRVTLENDIVKAIDVMKSAKDSGILSAITKDDESESKESRLMKALSNDGAIENILSIMVGSDTLRALIPEVINTGFSALYENVGVPKNAIDKKEKTLKEFYDEINTTNTKISNDPSKRAEYVAELSKSLDRIAGKNDYDFTALTSGRTEEAAKNVLDALFNEFAAKMTNDLSKPTAYNDDFVASLNISFTYSTENLHYNFATMSNCKRKTQEDLKLTNDLSESEWTNSEIAAIGGIFENFIAAYDSTKLPGDKFENFDFAALGEVFNCMRDSSLMDGKQYAKPAVADRKSFGTVKVLLQSSLMEGVSVNKSFLSTLEGQWETIDFAEAFETLGSTVKIMQAFNSIDKEIDANDVKTLIEGLSGESGESIKTILTDGILSSSESNDDTLVQAVTDIIDGIVSNASENLTDEQAQSEADALNTALDMLDKANSGEDASLNAETVETLLESDVITNAIIDATENNTELADKVQEAVKDENKDAIKAVIIDDYAAAKAIYESTSSTAEEKASAYAQMQKDISIYQMLFGEDLPTA